MCAAWHTCMVTVLPAPARPAIAHRWVRCSGAAAQAPGRRGRPTGQGGVVRFSLRRLVDGEGWVRVGAAVLGGGEGSVVVADIQGGLLQYERTTGSEEGSTLVDNDDQREGRTMRGEEAAAAAIFGDSSGGVDERDRGEVGCLQRARKERKGGEKGSGGAPLL
jgi:hypothetical protein